jgi:hypothetical protein
MSQSHVRVAKPQPRRRKWLEIAVGVTFLLIPAFYVLARTEGWFVPDFDSTTGQVLETRIVVDHTLDSQTGGHIYYRLEAHVKYTVPDEATPRRPDQSQDRWLTASEVTSTRELLTMLQAKQSKTCQVYWIPNHLEADRCRLG